MFAWLGEILYNFFAVMGFICTAITLIFIGLFVGSLQREQPQFPQSFDIHDEVNKILDEIEL